MKGRTIEKERENNLKNKKKKQKLRDWWGYNKICDIHDIRVTEGKKKRAGLNFIKLKQKEKTIQRTINFSSDTLEAERKWCQNFQVLKEKLSFPSEMKINK